MAADPESISPDHLDVLTFTLKAVEEAARQMERAIGAREAMTRYLEQRYGLTATDRIMVDTGKIERAQPDTAEYPKAV